MAVGYRMQWAQSIKYVAAVLIAAGSYLPADARAQERVAYHADLGLGLGSGSGGVEYRDRELNELHAAFGALIRVSTRWSAYGEVLLMRDIMSGSDTSCPLSPRGGCIPIYPQFDGVGIMLGAAVKPWQPFELRAGAGPAALSADGTDTRALVMHAELTLHISQHAGLLYGMRGNVIGDFNTERLTRRISYVGFRLR